MIKTVTDWLIRLAGNDKLVRFCVYLAFATAIFSVFLRLFYQIQIAETKSITPVPVSIDKITPP